MKRLVIFSIVLILFSIVGCSSESLNTKSERKDVTINLPTDDTVGGYRTNRVISSTVSDVIDANTVDVESKTSNATSSKTSSKIISSTQNDIVLETEYCANINSKVFHKSTCGSVKHMKEENKFFTKDKSMLYSSGYTPCKSCNP